MLEHDLARMRELNQARPNPEPVHGLEDQLVARRPVVAVAGEQADAGGVAPGYQTVRS